MKFYHIIKESPDWWNPEANSFKAAMPARDYCNIFLWPKESKWLQQSSLRFGYSHCGLFADNFSILTDLFWPIKSLKATRKCYKYLKRAGCFRCWINHSNQSGRSSGTLVQRDCPWLRAPLMYVPFTNPVLVRPLQAEHSSVFPFKGSFLILRSNNKQEHLWGQQINLLPNN